jgi:HK97 family phage portal protein
MPLLFGTKRAAAPASTGDSGGEQRASLENPSISLSDPRAFEVLFGANSTDAGVYVDRETALEVPAIWAAVNFIAGTIAALPLHIYQRDSDGNRQRVSNRLSRLLHDAPNEEWTSFAWRQHLMSNTLLGGRSYTFVQFNRVGQVRALYPLDPTGMIVERKNGRTRYRYRDEDGREYIYAPSEIIDLPFTLGPDGIQHYVPVNKLKRTIGLAIALEKYGARFFQNGGIPPTFLQGPSMSPSAAERASQDIQTKISEIAQSGGIPALPTGYELKAIGIDPEKSQMEASRRFQVEEVARVYDIPPVFLQDLTHGTYSNTEQQDLHFVKHTLTQWLRRIEQQLNLKLFPGENRNGQFVEFNVDGLLRGDFKTRMEGYAQAVQNSIKTPNEIRAKENDPPMAGGDRLVIQQNMSSLGDLAAQQQGDMTGGGDDADATE